MKLNNNYKKYFKPIIMLILVLLFMSIIYVIGEYCSTRAVILNTHIDDVIPYIKYFIYFYISWYLMLFILPLIAYKYNKKVFSIYICSITISLLITLIIFILYPTIMTRYELPIDTLSDKLVQFIYSVSSPTKCVPSLHVIFALSFILLTFNKEMSKKIKIMYYIFAFGITLSTLFIKQHLVYDVISAALVVVISYLLINKTKLGRNYISKVEKLL